MDSGPCRPGELTNDANAWWRARRVTATLRVAAVDAGGNRRTMTRKLTLHR